MFCSLESGQGKNHSCIGQIWIHSMELILSNENRYILIKKDPTKKITGDMRALLSR